MCSDIIDSYMIMDNNIKTDRLNKRVGLMQMQNQLGEHKLVCVCVL